MPTTVYGLTIPDEEYIDNGALQALAALIAAHNHDGSSTKGSAAQQLSTSHVPAAAGDVEVVNDVLQFFGTALRKVLPIQTAILTLTPAAVAANTTAEQSFVVASPFSATTAPAAVIKPTVQAGLGIVGHRQIDATHLGVTFSNN
ncbi:MAG TPA: hypothetical protein VF157_08675, partial [Chloroflexota bacterium]